MYILFLQLFFGLADDLNRPFLGYASSVWVDYFCSFIESNSSWRIPLFIQCVIGSILAAGSLLIPESPR